MHPYLYNKPENKIYEKEGKARSLTRNSQATESRKWKNCGTTLEQVEKASLKANDHTKRS